MRFQKTEDNIRNSFLLCVSSVGFEKTKISDICKKARISRNTFYAHYEDKYALMKSIYYSLEQNMSEAFEQQMKNDILNYSFESSVTWCIKEMSKNRELLQILIKCSENEFREIIGRVYIDKPLEEIVENYKVNSSSAEAKVCRAYILDGLVGVIKTWFENYDRISEKQIISLLTGLCTVPVRKHIEKITM